MFFLSLVCWSYIFYAAFKTNFDGRSVNEVVVDNIKSSKLDGEEETHLEDLATDHSPSLCVLRDTEENRALVKSVENISVVKYPDTICIDNKFHPIGRRKFRRSLYNRFGRLVIEEFETEINCIRWWDKVQRFVPMILYCPYLDLRHWIFKMRMKQKNPAVLNFFQSRVDNDVNRIWDCLEWGEMWSHYMMGKGHIEILRI